ncbi:MAG TPA: hypothetical protein VGF92_09655 [Stellaceae bacterium]
MIGAIATKDQRPAAISSLAAAMPVEDLTAALEAADAVICGIRVSPAGAAESLIGNPADNAFA